MALVVDTGPLYASIDASDADYIRCRRLLERSPEPLIVPSPVLVEVSQLIERRLSERHFSVVLANVSDGTIRIEDLRLEDYVRTRELCERYASARIGFVDAAVLAVVERLNEPKLATLDRRHFSILRPRHVEALTLLPE